MSATKADAGEVESWLHEHGNYLFRYAYMRLRHEEMARDTVQDTLTAAWQARGGFEGRASVRTWLVGILKHKITDQIRRQVRERKSNEQVQSDPTSDFFDAGGAWRQPPRDWRADPEQLIEDKQFLQVLNDCIGNLSSQQREVFTLRELNGESTQTVCNACGISTTNLHVIMHRARLALRRCLEMHWFGRQGEKESKET